MSRQTEIDRGIVEPPCNYQACLACENFGNAAWKVAKNPETNLLIGACHSNPITGESETKVDGYSDLGKWLESFTIEGQCPDVMRRIKPDSARES